MSRWDQVVGSFVHLFAMNGIAALSQLTVSFPKNVTHWSVTFSTFFIRTQHSSLDDC
jgi:hypothetical protein